MSFEKCLLTEIFWPERAPSRTASRRGGVARRSSASRDFCSRRVGRRPTVRPSGLRRRAALGAGASVRRDQDGRGKAVVRRAELGDRARRQRGPEAWNSPVAGPASRLAESRVYLCTPVGGRASVLPAPTAGLTRCPAPDLVRHRCRIAWRLSHKRTGPKFLVATRQVPDSAPSHFGRGDAAPAG